jgi:hypothetical protein
MAPAAPGRFAILAPPRTSSAVRSRRDMRSFVSDEQPNAAGRDSDLTADCRVAAARFLVLPVYAATETSGSKKRAAPPQTVGTDTPLHVLASARSWEIASSSDAS